MHSSWVSLEDVTHRLIGDLVAQIGQGTLEAVVSPSGMLPSKPQNKIDDLLPDTWPTHRVAALALIPLFGD